jgi:hypothetical protein
MTLAEMVQEVYAITKRSDMVTQTDSAIRMATLRAHQLDFWQRDLREEIVDFLTPAYAITWNPKTAYPRFRAVNYIVKVQHPSDEIYGKPLENHSPIGSYDSYGIQKQNVWYMAGAAIRLNFSEQVRKVAAGFYQHPDIAAPAYSSWIADDYPWAIIERAAAKILTQTGNTDLAVSATQRANEQDALLKISNVQDIGY